MSKLGSNKGPGIYSQKSFGFRSQYGGIGLKNNFLKSKHGQSVSSYGRLSDSKFLGGSRFGIGGTNTGNRYKNNYLDNSMKDS